MSHVQQIWKVHGDKRDKRWKINFDLKIKGTPPPFHWEVQMALMKSENLIKSQIKVWNPGLKIDGG